MELTREQFLELERVLRRENAHSFLFRFMVNDTDDGVEIYLYSGYEYGKPMGEAAYLWEDLTTGLDKVYNVIVSYRPEHSTDVWKMTIATQQPDLLRAELERLYG